MFGLFLRRTSFCSSRSVSSFLQAGLRKPCIANVLNFSLYKNFQGFKHCSIFHFQGSVFVSRLPLSKQLIYYIKSFRFCQALFYFVLKLFNFLVACVSTATFISYHVVADLSTSLLFFLIFCFDQCPCFQGRGL